MFHRRAKGEKAAWTVAIVVASALLGMVTNWRVPALDRFGRDWLVRTRGPRPAPDDIAIVAIDEASQARFGRFPWSRRVIARTVDAISAAQPKAIAVDVLFTDATTPEDDDDLAGAIGRAGNVVVAAQLADAPVRGGPSQWLLPFPTLEMAAAGIGHVNVQTETDGVPRQIEVAAADGSGRVLRAMAVELVRVADGTPGQSVQATLHAMVLGPRRIPIDSSPPALVIASSPTTHPAPQVLRSGRMNIDFVGPTGSFSQQTYSLAEVVDGRVPPSRFRGKYVVIGATAAAMGDHLASPFTHQTDDLSDEHGAFMPGVEVLANELDTILRGRYITATSTAASFLLAALAALFTVMLLELAQGGHEFVKEILAIGGAAIFILLAGYLLYTQFLVLPPLVPMTVAFASAGTLTLLRRSLSASARLDSGIAGLALPGELLFPTSAPKAPRQHGLLPHGLEWKARTLSELHSALMDRARFVDCALRSVDDGLIIANPTGGITFANPRAGEMLGASPEALAGRNLLDTVLSPGDRELLSRLVQEGTRIEREISCREPRAAHYMLRMAAVSAGEEGDGVLGIVASLSDVTRQHDLQQTKNDVISLVSHEMRTPLTAIQGMTELLAEYDLDPARRREMHQAINDEVKRLTRMITEYLDITRLESGATAVRKTPVNIPLLIERILLLLDPVAERRHIRLVRRVSPELPGIIADGDLLSRAIENLVSNAIKYSPCGTEVTISASADPSAVTIAVADQGYGIPESDQRRIFEKFYRVPRVQDAETPGTGLGLALVREIAELHNGSVSVKSEVHSGSSFTLRIPRAESAGE